jgi:hypothetical protein
MNAGPWLDMALSVPRIFLHVKEAALALDNRLVGKELCELSIDIIWNNAVRQAQRLLNEFSFIHRSPLYGDKDNAEIMGVVTVINV